MDVGWLGYFVARGHHVFRVYIAALAVIDWVGGVVAHSEGDRLMTLGKYRDPVVSSVQLGDATK